MRETSEMVRVRKYSVEEQGVGAFDGGRITESKPVPFPQETGGSRRIGPLLYWAWATAEGDGVIGMHPHRGFEIMSYVLEGSVGHTDSAGNRRRVGVGGAQVMQTGSGISHQEEMHGERTSFFQIWFEPDLGEALQRAPVYEDFEDGDFPVEESGGVWVKRVIGGGAPVEIVAPVEVVDVRVEAGAEHAVELGAGEVLASVVIEGNGSLRAGGETGIGRGDFVVAEATGAAVVVVSGKTESVHVLVVRVPSEVDYPLYR